MIDSAKVRRDFPVLARKVRGRQIIYFDTACMALKPEPVIEAMNDYYRNYPGCHGRTEHLFGIETTRAFAQARQAVRKFVNAAHPDEVLFVRNATEGIRIAAGLASLKAGDVVVTSDIEHNSNMLAWIHMQRTAGIVHRVVKTNDDTTFSMERFLEALEGPVRLVSVLHVSNLSGVTFPVKEIARAARERGALVLIDAAQGVMTERIDVRDWRADFVTFSGHKAMGPTGTGVLWARGSILRAAQGLHPGGETVLDSTYDDFVEAPPPDRFEPGLQDYAGAIGCARALEYVNGLGQRSIREHVTALNRALTEGILALPGVRLIGPRDPALRGSILNAAFDAVPSRDLAHLLNETSAIMARAGKHCVNPWFNGTGHPESLRLSLGVYNTREEVEIFLEVLYTVLRNFS